MKLKFSDTEKMILLSVSFTVALLIVRMVYAGNLTYIFYPWNLFLAMIPMYFSRQLKQAVMGYKTILLLCAWLLFFPNAPYLVTDIFHFEERPPVPQWFDLLIVVSGAWNGLLLCMVSLRQVEQFLSAYVKKKWLNTITVSFLFLCGYGIYLGRYLRYNSWDIFVKPITILNSSLHHIFQPVTYHSIWAFTISFSAFLSLVYFSMKYVKLQASNGEQ